MRTGGLGIVGLFCGWRMPLEASQTPMFVADFRAGATSCDIFVSLMLHANGSISISFSSIAKKIRWFWQNPEGIFHQTCYLTQLLWNSTMAAKPCATSIYNIDNFKKSALVYHEAVAEVSRIGNYRRDWLLWVTNGRAKTLMDRTVQLCNWLTDSLTDCRTDQVTNWLIVS